MLFRYMCMCGAGHELMQEEIQEAFADDIYCNAKRVNLAHTTRIVYVQVRKPLI